MDPLNMNTLIFSNDYCENLELDEPNCAQITECNAQPEFGVKLDYLSFSLAVGVTAGLDLPEVVRHIFSAGNNDCEKRLKFEESGGWQGYRNSARLIWIQDVGSKTFHQNIGLIAFGGESQRGRVYVSFSGAGCDVVGTDGLSWLSNNFERFKVNLTRIDIAIDDFSGKNSIESTLRRYKKGEFSNKKAEPKFQYIQKGAGDKSGETIYIGSRASGKLCRVYQKGRQLGDPNSKWLRVEMQFGGHQRKLPKEMLLDPLPYALGAYPALSKMFPCNVLPNKIKTIRVTSKISVLKALSNLRRNSGPTINTLLQSGVSGRNLLSVLNKVNSKVPKRLSTCGIDRAILGIGLDSPGLKSGNLFRSLGELTEHLDSMWSVEKIDDEALCFTTPAKLFGRNSVTVTSLDAGVTI